MDYEQEGFLSKSIFLQDLPKAIIGEEADKISQSRLKELEIILGGSVDFLPFSFLPQGHKVGQAVCLVVVYQKGPQGPEKLGTGTGFLVGPNLLMTNNHVINSPDAASLSCAQFKYEVSVDGTELEPVKFELDPSLFFITSPFDKLDFSIVGIKQHGATIAGKQFGWIPLRRSKSKIAKGEHVNIIQHPSGRRKEVVLQENKVIDFLEGGYLHYSTDTEGGSSGSPLFNNQWDLIGIHHRAVAARNSQGEPIVSNGEYVYTSNEGIRISAICDYLDKLSLGSREKAILQSILFD